MSPRTDKRAVNPSALASNRKALHDYFVLEKYEAGIELVGTEIKVVCSAQASLQGAYVRVEPDGQLWLLQANIPPYEFGNRFNHDPRRPRRLLMHRREILRLKGQSEQKGLTLVPLRLYRSPRGKVKVEVAVCRGKADADKRETIKRREADKEARRAMARYGR